MVIYKPSASFLSYNDIFKRDVLPFLRKKFPRDKYTEPIWYYTTDIPRSMFRSVIPLCLARVFRKDIRKVLPVIAASEIIFSITLAQDDIIDGDKQRQGFPSAWKKYGLPICVASIDYCYFYAYKILKEVEKYVPRERAKMIYDAFLEGQKLVNKSFMFEKIHKNDFSLGLEDMKNLMEWKTITGITDQYCSMLALNCDLDDCRNMRRYAVLNGYAGQVKNDILDFFYIKGYEEYRKFSDFKEGYMNYAIIRLHNLCSKADRKVLEGSYGKGGKPNIERILELIEKYGLQKIVMNDCRKFVRDAKNSIATFRDCPEKDMIMSWADSAVKFSRSK
ncbi:MAG: polyprenyl synthetase family protein [Candidatus Aenigmarchaeota archaeon]|nr:polyprenyl synthetase family protein [Candidatus Aenigmarchaeota archaeon]